MTGNGNAYIVVGRVKTSDGGSHTIDTSGSSALGWRNSNATFSNAGTSVSVGLAAVDTSNGPPGRPVNSAGTITFDVKAVLTGGGGGITNGGWQNNAPTTGTKTIADGDLVAFAVQFTALGGSDFIFATCPRTGSGNSILLPAVSQYTGSFNAQSAFLSNIVITFNDGAIGYFAGGDVASVFNNQNYNNTSSPKEYGQLYQMPFPMKVCGMYAYISNSGDFTLNLYSDPLGTPTVQANQAVSQKTVLTTGNPAWVYAEFGTSYQVAANQPIGAVVTPSTSTNTQLYYKTLASAAHRVADVWGTSGYGISRSSGAFANTNSSLDHYYVGLLVSAFDDAAGGGGGGGSGGGYVIGS
ncbi:hypothetical protein [Bradyrhizobium sp. USDA 3256]